MGLDTHKDYRYLTIEKLSDLLAMERLPHELVTSIAHHCDKASLLALRETSRFTQDAATPYAFERVYIGYQAKFMSRIASIASSSSLAKHVQRLTINTEILPAFTRDQYEHYLVHTIAKDANSDIDMDIIGRLPGPVLDRNELVTILIDRLGESKLSDGWQHFFQLSRSQRGLWTNVQHPSLDRALQLLPNLQKVDLVDERGRHRERFQTWTAQTQYGAACSPWKEALIDPWLYDLFNWHQWMTFNFSPGQEADGNAEAIYHVGLALASRDNLGKENPTMERKPVIGMTCEVGHHEPLGSYYSGGRSSAVHLTNISSFLQSLSSLKLSMESLQFGDDGGEEVLQEILLGLFEARSLRRLDLDIGSQAAGPFNTLMESSEGPVWPGLEYLRFSGSIWIFDLFTFINMQVKSLKSLEVTDVTLYPFEEGPSIWHRPPMLRLDDMLEKLMTAGLNLQHARLSRLTCRNEPHYTPRTFFPIVAGSRADVSRHVGAYLTRRRNELPRLEHWDFEPHQCSIHDCWHTPDGDEPRH